VNSLRAGLASGHTDVLNVRNDSGKFGIVFGTALLHLLIPFLVKFQPRRPLTRGWLNHFFLTVRRDLPAQQFFDAPGCFFPIGGSVEVDRDAISAADGSSISLNELMICKNVTLPRLWLNTL